MQRRLAFLAAFLDNSAIRDSSVDAEKYDGPHAAFSFGKIEVRNFAAVKIASILGLNDQPTDGWTEGQWAKLRRKVGAALDREDLPTLTDE